MALSESNLLLAALAIATLPFAILIALRPKLLVIITVLLTLTELTLAQLTRSSSVFTYADDALCLLAPIVCALPRLRGDRPIRQLPGGRWFLLYFVLGLSSSIVQNVPLGLALSGSLSFIKGPLLGFAIAQVDWSARDVRRLKVGAIRLLVIILMFAGVNALTPGSWARRFSPGFQSRGGSLPTLIGPFTIPGAFGTIMALSASALVAGAGFREFSRRRSRQRERLLGALSVLGVILSFRRISIIALIGAITAARAKLRVRNRAPFFTGLVIVMGGTAALFHNFVTSAISSAYRDYVLNGKAPRTLLYRGSITVAHDYFPFGAGFARYGSYLSGVHYSPVYFRLGFENVYGLEPGIGGLYFTDTFWPAILGESGLFGLVAFAGGLIAIWRLAKRWTVETNRELQTMAYVLVAWSVEFAIESLVAPAYSSPPAFSLLFALTGLLVARADCLQGNKGGTGERNEVLSTSGDRVAGRVKRPIPAETPSGSYAPPDIR